jgi:hypothetical protein
MMDALFSQSITLQIEFENLESFLCLCFLLDIVAARHQVPEVFSFGFVFVLFMLVISGQELLDICIPEPISSVSG